jgi:hypothetical protein
MHNEQQAGNIAVEVLASPVAEARAKRTWEPFERALKAKEKSTSAKGRLIGEDVAPARASGKGGYEECTQERWEGYDPGMDPDS